MEYEQLFECFYQNKVRYVICGGLAVNIYGIPRMTADIDLIIDFIPENISLFETCMKGIGYHASIPVPLREMADSEKRNALIRDKNMMTYSFYNSRAGQVAVDVLVNVPLSFEKLWENRETRSLGTGEVYLSSIPDLITLKEFAGRPQDKNDIILLSQLLNK